VTARWIAAMFAATVAAAQTRVPAPVDWQIVALERRLKQTPSDNALRGELAGAFLQKMRESADGSYLERASELVAAILKGDPADYAARRRKIEIEMHRHRFKQVVGLAEALARERSGDSTVWALMGDALMELGEYERAADAYQRTVDLKPGLAGYNRVAFYRFVTGDAEGAIQAMRQAIRVGAPAPENIAWCLADLGNILLKTGEIEAAEQEFRRALARFPGYHPALAGLARVFDAQGRTSEAIESLLQAQARAPFPEYTGMLARLYRKAGKADLANQQIALLDVADRLGQAAGERANRNLALAFADLRHRTERALELARAELEVRCDVYTYDALAWALFRAGKTAEAADAMRKALSHGTPEPSFHQHAAQIFEALGDEGEARKHRQRAAALNPRLEN
jgi:tetratricopeptide (TPR) repeat protein